MKDRSDNCAFGVDAEVKFCVTAIIDLQGISSHLEVGVDLRTNIGRQIIGRLKCLDEAVKLFDSERDRLGSDYPTALRYKRINDALILCMDLPDEFMPEPGKTQRVGYSFAELNHICSQKGMNLKALTEEEFNNKLFDVRDLSQFIGLTARVHNYVSSRESDSCFPGCKTVVSTGIRRKYDNETEDILGANFSFSNAYIAEKSLRGPNFFIDEIILSILCQSKLNQNLVKRSLLLHNQCTTDYFNSTSLFPSLVYDLEEEDPISFNILRKDYVFRKVDAVVLSYLQLYNHYNPSEHVELGNENINPALERLKKYLNCEFESKDDVKKAFCLLFGVKFDLTTDLESLYKN